MPFAVAPSRRVFVDPVNGSPTGTGASTSPVNTIDTAASILGTVRKVSGIILVKATAAAPYTGAVTIPATVTTNLTIAPWGSPRMVMHVTTSAAALRVLSLATTTLLRCEIVSSGTTGVRLGDTGLSGGKLVAYDSYAEGQTQGWQTTGVTVGMDLYRCRGLGVTNDGFNHHGDPGVHSVMNLYDCRAYGCGDEGASPHDDTIMNIYGGHFDGNAGGGMDAANNSVCHIYRSLRDGSRPTFDRNGHDTVYGGIGFLDNSSGSVNGAQTIGNLGPGFQNTGTGIVTKSDLVSSGNGAPDFG